ncbi:MAG: c-type cytochrome [Methylovirgula sp.]|jgi:mono/diheme cytochrome c family protein
MSLSFARMILASAATVALLAAPARAQDLSAADLIAAGHTFALRVCWTCHVVATDQTVAPILQHPAPSFLGLAQRPDLNAKALRNFLSTHNETMGKAGQMPNPRLVDYQIDEVVAYIMSLKKGSR